MGDGLRKQGPSAIHADVQCRVEPKAADQPGHDIGFANAASAAEVKRHLRQHGLDLTEQFV
jgi:hypothetical protein